MQEAAQLAAALGRSEEAASEFRKLLELNPEIPNVHTLIGLTHLAGSRTQEALAEIQQEKDCILDIFTSS